MLKYHVDIESFRQNFPEGFQVPKLLVEFGFWLSSQRAASVGYFRLHGDRFDDNWIENGADLHPSFAFFLTDPTGSRLGYWLYDGLQTVAPPIVLVGSEGELSIVSDTLEEFLHKLAHGATDVEDLDSRAPGGDEQAQFTKWLKSHVGDKSVQPRRDHPDLSSWMENWGQRQRDWLNSDLDHNQIAEKLRKYVKPNAEPWETANFEVAIIGKQFVISQRSWPPNPMDPSEVSDLEPLFRRVREQRAVKIPERGLWFSAWVTVGAEGPAILACDFLNEPKIGDKPLSVPVIEYQRDLVDFPRSKHWMPKWLKSS